MFYYAKTPFWIKKLYKRGLWQLPGLRKVIYLSFDDGPHPAITSFVLDELDKFNAKASFFCIGKNVLAYPDTYQQILDRGHAVGNHTYDHLNGWKTKNDVYLENVLQAKRLIDSNLFRPPYGRIKGSQLKALTGPEYRFHTVMWTVLSGDFDKGISAEKCYHNVIDNTTSGSIVVFHDSEKANDKLRYTLPLVLEHFSQQGYLFEKINTG